MKIASSLPAFALSTLAVTSACATPQDDCLNKVAKVWSKNATFLASRTTIMPSTTAAFLIARSDTSSTIMTIDTVFRTAYFYDNPQITPEAFTTENIDEIGLLKDHRPDRVGSAEKDPKVGVMREALKNCIEPK